MSPLTCDLVQMTANESQYSVALPRGAVSCSAVLIVLFSDHTHLLFWAHYVSTAKRHLKCPSQETSLSSKLNIQHICIIYELLIDGRSIATAHRVGLVVLLVQASPLTKYLCCVLKQNTLSAA